MVVKSTSGHLSILITLLLVMEVMDFVALLMAQWNSLVIMICPLKWNAKSFAPTCSCVEGINTGEVADPKTATFTLLRILFQRTQAHLHPVNSSKASLVYQDTLGLGEGFAYGTVSNRQKCNLYTKAETTSTRLSFGRCW